MKKVYLILCIAVSVVLSACVSENVPANSSSAEPSSGMAQSETDMESEHSSIPHPDSNSSESSSTPAPASSSSASVPEQQNRQIQFKVIDPDGNPLPNIAVSVGGDAYDFDYLMSHRTAAMTDLTGFANSKLNILPAPVQITMENIGISYSDEQSDRFQELSLSESEIRSSPEIMELTWDGPSYREAVENRPVIIGFRAVDTEGLPVPNATISFYCSGHPTDGTDGKYLDGNSSDVLTAGGFTENDGVFLYGFTSFDRDGFEYTATATYEGKTGTGTLTVKGEKTIIDIVIS